MAGELGFELLCQDQDASFAESLRTLRLDQEHIKERLADNRRQATNLVKMMTRMEEEPPEAMLQQCREFEREKTELEATLSRMSEEVSKLEQTSMRVDMAGKTLRCLADILGHDRVTPDHLKDCLPKFINYVMWQKEAKAHTGRFEVALFERPFRVDQGRLLREVVEDLAAGPSGDGQKSLESHTPRQNGAACCPTRVWCAGGYEMG